MGLPEWSQHPPSANDSKTVHIITNCALPSQWDTWADWKREEGGATARWGRPLRARAEPPSAVCCDEAWVQRLLEDISVIYVLVCTTHFFRCRWRVEELDRILRTRIAQGSEKSLCCVKVRLPLAQSHAWMPLCAAKTSLCCDSVS